MKPRILMTEADASPGGGSPETPPKPNTTDQPPAQAATLTRDDLKAFAKEMRDGIFADLRKAGAFEKKTKAPPPPEPTDSEVQPSSAPPAPDLMKLRELDRAIAISGHKVGSAAYKRIEREFTTDAPTNAEEWVKEYFADMGVAPPQAPPPPTTKGADPPPAPKNDRPASDRGTPPAPRLPDNEVDLFSLSPEERIELQKRLPPKEFVALLRKQTKDRNFTVR
jgi:hypothetical protein